MDLIRAHTNWTNTVQEVHDFTLDDLLDGAKPPVSLDSNGPQELYKPLHKRHTILRLAFPHHKRLPTVS